MPIWVIAVNAAPGSSQPKAAPTIRRCALEEIGRNSVSPWTTPRTTASNQPMRSADAGDGGRTAGRRRHGGTGRGLRRLRRADTVPGRAGPGGGVPGRPVSLARDAPAAHR